MIHVSFVLKHSWCPHKNKHINTCTRKKKHTLIITVHTCALCVCVLCVCVRVCVCEWRINNLEPFIFIHLKTASCGIADLITSGHQVRPRRISLDSFCLSRCPSELCGCIFKMPSRFNELDGTFWYSQVHTAWVIRPFLVTESCNVQPLRRLVLGKQPSPAWTWGEERRGEVRREDGGKKGDKSGSLTLMQSEMSCNAPSLNWKNWPSS